VDVQDEANLEHRGPGLEEGGDAPAPVAVHGLCTKGYAGGDKGTYKVERVEEGGHDGSLFGIGEFAHERGACYNAERNTEAEDEARYDVHGCCELLVLISKTRKTTCR
jgi:hypothetical protein